MNKEKKNNINGLAKKPNELEIHPVWQHWSFRQDGYGVEKDTACSQSSSPEGRLDLLKFRTKIDFGKCAVNRMLFDLWHVAKNVEKLYNLGLLK